MTGVSVNQYSNTNWSPQWQNNPNFSNNTWGSTNAGANPIFGAGTSWSPMTAFGWGNNTTSTSSSRPKTVEEIKKEKAEKNKKITEYIEQKAQFNAQKAEIDKAKADFDKSKNADGTATVIKDIKETLWEINCDGYYPYCPKCKYEPGNRNLTHFCPNCGADLRGDKSKNRIPLSKAEFCKVLDSLRRNKEFLDELNNVLSKIDEDNFIYSTGLEFYLKTKKINGFLIGFGKKTAAKNTKGAML